MPLNRLLDREVRERANHRCEYCLIPQNAFKLKFPIDHIVARQHGGPSESDNLCLCCGNCNLNKGPNLSGIDPVSGSLTRLFNPRADSWGEHFSFENAMLLGKTPIGRTTIVVLKINHPVNIATRTALLRAQAHP